MSRISTVHLNLQKMADLEDFEAFTEPDFSPTGFASTLLLATNVLDDTELDLATAIKKLKFDANECERRMEKLASNNYELLIANLGNIDSTRALMEEKINPLVTRMNKAYERIHNDIVEPYDDAVKLNGALKRVHSTASLLRGAGFFLLFVQQVHDCEVSLEKSDDNKDVVRLAKLHKQLSDFFSKVVMQFKAEGTDLLSLKLIRDYQPVFTAKNEQLIGDLSSKISNDLGHHSSFVHDNKTLQNNLVALHTLDLEEFLLVINKMAIAKSIHVALNLLTRSLQSPRNLTAVLAEVKQTSAVFCSTLAALLENCIAATSEAGQPTQTLLQVFASSLEDGQTADVEAIYWSRLAYKFKKSIAVTMARGGPIARNLRSHYSVISESTDSVLDEPAATNIKDALTIIANVNNV